MTSVCAESMDIAKHSWAVLYGEVMLGCVVVFFLFFMSKLQLSCTCEIWEVYIQINVLFVRYTYLLAAGYHFFTMYRNWKIYPFCPHVIS